MEVNNRQYISKESMENHTNQNSDRKNDNAEAGKSPFCWKYPPKCIINITEFLE